MQTRLTKDEICYTDNILNSDLVSPKSGALENEKRVQERFRVSFVNNSDAVIGRIRSPRFIDIKVLVWQQNRPRQGHEF